MIPKQVPASAAIARQQRFEGVLKVKNLPRLAEAAPGEQGDLNVELMADRQQGYPTLHGRIDGSFKLVCQRCAKSYDWALKLPLSLRLVFSEDEERAALQNSDPYRVEDDELPIWQVLEDEVLLALPMLPRCETCENKLDAPSAKPARQESGRAVQGNPFAALKGKLKK